MRNNIISKICKQVIKEAILHKINESEDETLNDGIKVLDKEKMSNEIKFFIPKKGINGNNVAGIDLLNHYLGKLKTLRNKAISVGVTLTFDFYEETIEGKNGYTIIIKSDYPEIKVDGYKFIGCVYPIAGLSYGLICPSSEFKNNIDVCNQIKNVAVHGTCDGCHRTTDRSCYYMFLDEKTNEIKKFGGTCAQKYFGINISNKVRDLFYALYNAFSEDPYYNDLIDDRMTSPSFRTLVNNKLEIMAYSSCTFIALYGPYERVKGNSDFYRIQKYYAASDQEIKKYQQDTEYSDIIKSFDKTMNLYFDFMKNGFKWAESLEPKNNFELSLQQHALVLSGVNVTKKAMGSIKPGIIPYVFLAYFQSKEKEQDNRPILKPFNGIKTFRVNIQDIKEMQSKFNNSLYYFYIGETNNNELVCWALNQKDENIKINDNVQVNGEYLRRSKDDKYAILTKVSLGENGKTEEKEVSYPEDGYKYVKDNAKFLKVTEDYFLVEMSDGCKYYINNKKSTMGYRGYITTEIKFKDWENFSVGQEIILTGKVKSYLRNNGGTGYKLTYVKFS